MIPVISVGLGGYGLPSFLSIIVSPFSIVVRNLYVIPVSVDKIRFICIQWVIFAIINLIIASFRPPGRIVFHFTIDIQTGVDVVTVTAARCNTCSGNRTSSSILIRCKANDGDSVVYVIGLGVILNLTNKRI